MSPEEQVTDYLAGFGLGIIPYKYANSYFFSFNKAFKLLVNVLRQIKKQKGIFRNAFCILGNGETSTNVRQVLKLYTTS